MTTPQQPGDDDQDRTPEEGGSAQQPQADQSASESAETPVRPASEQASSEDTSTSEDSSTPEDTSEKPTAEESAAETKTSKKRTSVIVGIAAAILVVVGGGAAIFAATNASASAESVAEDYVNLSTKEAQQPRSVTADDYRPLICSKAMPQIEQLQQQKQQFLKSANQQQLDQIKQIKTTLKGVQENGETAKATFESTVPGQKPQTSELNLIKEEGDWKICTG